MKNLIYMALCAMAFFSCEKEPVTTQFTQVDGFFEYEYPSTVVAEDGSASTLEGKRRVVINRATARVSESPNRPDISRRVDLYLYPDNESGFESDAQQYIHACLVDSLIQLDGPANAHYKVKNLDELQSNPKSSVCLELDGILASGDSGEEEGGAFQIEKTLDTELKVLAIYPGTYQVIGNGNVGEYKYQFCYTGPIEVLKD